MKIRMDSTENSHLPFNTTKAQNKGSDLMDEKQPRQQTTIQKRKGQCSLREGYLA